MTVLYVEQINLALVSILSKQTKNTNPNIKCFDMFYQLPYSFKCNAMMVIAFSNNTEQHVHTPLKKSY